MLLYELRPNAPSAGAFDEPSPQRREDEQAGRDLAGGFQSFEDVRGLEGVEHEAFADEDDSPIGGGTLPEGVRRRMGPR